MKIAYHLGVHCTDEEQLLRCLLKNRGVLAKEGIAVPGPNRYRPVLRDAMNSLQGVPASPETEESILDSVLDDRSVERVIFSHDSFLGMRQKAVGPALFYPNAADKIRWMSQLFPNHEVEFHLSIRNPATFLPAVLQQVSEIGHDDLLDGIDPTVLRWSNLIERIRSSAPEAALTVWCNEDTPLIWPEVLREVAGHDPYTQLEDSHGILSAIMSPEGFKRMLAYLESHPPQTEIQRRRIAAAFLDKFALEEEIEMELDLPGWTEEFVDSLTASYEEDSYEISRIPGVNFIHP